MLPGILAVYLIVVNLSAFAMFGVDKRRARKHRWRIPERRLFGVALAGGSLGALAGMYGFRHKTSHKLFSVGVPLLFIVQDGLVIVCCWKIFL